MAKNRNNRQPKKVPRKAAKAGSSKQPIQQEQATAHKRVVPGPTTEGNHTMVWRFGMVDDEGDWAWTKLDAAIWALIMTKLSGWESQTATAFFQHRKKGHHCITIKKLCSKAQVRLLDLELDDHGELWSLRVGTSPTARIWGIRREHVFYFLWWDPDHTVYPVAKKHT